MRRPKSYWRVAVAIVLFCGAAVQAAASSPDSVGCDRAAESNPPSVVRGVASVPEAVPVVHQAAAAIEWTFHKSGDGLHPDGNEQQFLWLTNRARSDPAREGVWLATMQDPQVSAARDHFNVNGAVLQSEFAGYPVKPPAAFDVRLYNAAKGHADYLIGIDSQNHDNQIERIGSAGFNYNQAAAIVFAYSHHTIHGYAGFNIDWGSGSNGTQDPPGHRYAIMSVGSDYTNIGIAVVPETNPATQVGPQVIAGNFCHADDGSLNHFNRFIVGTVWEDVNSNGQYDPGEGLADVTVMPDKGLYFAVTGDAGGYAIPILAADSYQLVFSGGDLGAAVTRTAAVGSASVLLDLEYDGASSISPPVDSGDGADADSSAGGGSGGGGGCLIGVAADRHEGLRELGVLLVPACVLAGVAAISKKNRRRRPVRKQAAPPARSWR
jgi:hypothetical protein